MKTTYQRSQAPAYGKQPSIRVLLVDDDPDYGTIVRRLLARDLTSCFDVTTMGSADEAVSADLDMFDIVLLDQQLGGRTGLDVLRWWRARGSGTPVIMLTAMGGPTTDLAASEAGAFDYLDKADLEPRMLERAIRYAMLAAAAVRSERQTAQMQSAVARAGRALLDVVDPAGLAAQVPRAAVEELGADAAWLSESGDDGRITPVAMFPPDFPNVIAGPESGDGSPADRAVRSGSPIVIDVMGKTDLLTGSAAMFPLITPERVAGVLADYSRTPRFFTVPVVEAFGMYTSQAALAFRAARLQQQVQRALRTEAIGRLAGGVAHDFNNLLTAILGYAELLAEGDLSAEQCAAVEEIRAAADRAAGVTRHLLAFGRRQFLRPELLDLGEVVSGIERLLGQVIPDNVRLVTVRSDRPATAIVDRSQIEQVLLNLAVNSRQALVQGGILVMSTQVTHVRAPRPAHEGTIEPGTYAEVSVTDTGCGMDAATQARAFEPFFTTRPVGEGSGLGLPSVLGIVEQSGGRVVLESAADRGTTISLYFPWSDRNSAPKSPAEGNADRPMVTAGTILIVEDQENVRSLLARVLRLAGHRVVEASSCEEALKRLVETADIDLVVSDVVMPGIGGRALLEEMRQRGLGAPVLLISGYPEETEMADAPLPAGVAFLMKPFPPQTLVTRVRELLAQ